MSFNSPRVASPRARVPPPPLRLPNSSFNSKHDEQQSQLLYDVPTPIPPSPQRSPIPTPTSPTARMRATAINRSRRTPPPPSASSLRAQTPPPFFNDDLEKFAALCRAWYYNQDEESGAKMTKTISDLPASQRAHFAKLQASIRAAYHAAQSARKVAEFRAHLNATQPGGSLAPFARANPKGDAARKERYKRLSHFILTWCNAGMPGTKPFFEALWGVLRLQILPENLGGAGSRRMVWEFDDAVFMESAGKDFMLEAIDVLKGVLGFEEKLSSQSRPFRLSKDNSHYRSPSEPLWSKQNASIPHQNPGTQPPIPKRPRSPSDPFLDRPSRSRSLGSAILMPPGPSGATIGMRQETVDEEDAFSTHSEDDCLRSWTCPDFTNPEIMSLLGAFPALISRRSLPRFPVSNTKPSDLERGEEALEEGREEVRIGTGIMWISRSERSEGWRGGWWERFKAWWRRILC